MPELRPLSPEALAVYSVDDLDGMTGEITQEDIDNSIECDHEKCALAVAVGRMFPGYTVSVDDYAAVWHPEGEPSFDICLTDEILKWIDRFDNSKKVQPIKLIIKMQAGNGADCYPMLKVKWW